MAFSVHEYTGDGSTTQFVVNFTLGYLAQSHVECYVEGEVDGLGDPILRTITWISAGLIDIGAAPANGLSVTVRRNTPKDALIHDYSDGAVFAESNLDDSNLQNIFLAHELLDGYSLSRAYNLDMNGYRIVDLADPIDDQDGATQAYVKEIAGYDKVEFAAEWANKAEDALISAEAGGDEVDDYSALHHSAKAAAEVDLAVTARTGAETAETNAETAETNAAGHEAKAQDWAEEVEDTEVETGQYSSLHWAAKSQASASRMGTLNVVTIEIGDWDMDTLNAVSVLHGLADWTKIRSVSAMILDDNSTNMYNLLYDNTVGTGTSAIYVQNSGHIALARHIGGIFDNSGFDSTSFNRGFITIHYED